MSVLVGGVTNETEYCVEIDVKVDRIFLCIISSSRGEEFVPLIR